MDFVVPADHRGKLNEGEKKDKYLELKKLWNMIPVVNYVFVTVTKELIKYLEVLKIRGPMVTIQTVEFLRSTGMP